MYMYVYVLHYDMIWYDMIWYDMPRLSPPNYLLMAFPKNLMPANS